MSRANVAIKPVKHFTSTVIILTDSQPVKTLLVHHRKYGRWLSPGGHQEAHENPVETAIREVQEETGLDISKLLPSVERIDREASYIQLPAYLLEEYIEPYGDQPEHYHLDMTYVVRLPEQAVTHSVQEAHDIGWFTLEQTEELPTYENVRVLLRREMAS